MRNKFCIYDLTDQHQCSVGSFDPSHALPSIAPSSYLSLNSSLLCAPPPALNQSLDIGAVEAITLVERCMYISYKAKSNVQWARTQGGKIRYHYHSAPTIERGIQNLECLYVGPVVLTPHLVYSFARDAWKPYIIKARFKIQLLARIQCLFQSRIQFHTHSPL